MSEWKGIIITQYCIAVKDGTHDSPKRTENGYKLLTSKHIGGEKLLIDEAYYISEEDYIAINSRSKVDKWDILMGMIGTVGELYLVDSEPNFAIKNMALIKCGTEHKAKWIYYYLKSTPGQQQIQGKMSGSSQRFISLGDMRSLIIPNPEEKIQRKIINILTTYDNLIENNNRRIAILEEMAQKLYREWFVHFRFPGHEKVKMVESEMGMIPEGWAVSTIYDEAYILGGGTPSKANPEFWQGGEIPLFSPRDATGQTYVENTAMNITELGLKKCNSGLYPRNTIVITARGTVGKIVLVAENMAINQSCYALQSKGISQFYLLHMLRSAVEELKKVATGTAFDAIITETFKNIKCLVPVKSVCLEFEYLLTNIYDAILVLQQKNTNLRKTRDLLLPRLISGDIDVSELDIPIKEG